MYSAKSHLRPTASTFCLSQAYGCSDRYNQAVGFLSKTFNEAKCNYDIHDRELLAVFRVLTHWQHLLLSSPHEVTVLTDHKNLEYYKEPHHIN